MKVLLIEDDKDLCEALSFKLKKEGYDVDVCFCGDEAIYYGNTMSYDIIILDRMLPFIDGLTILQTLRKNRITIPIIMVTAMNGINDRIDGLDAGADDYLVKPFDIGELLARIRALSRRPRAIESNTIVKFSNFSLETDKHLLAADLKTVTLSNKESCLLEFFIRNHSQILTRELLLARVWGIDSFVEDGNLDNYIYFVRRRLKAAGCEARIKTIHSVGYQLEESRSI
jgi:DNA-binding response OmpR family regulator